MSLKTNASFMVYAYAFSLLLLPAITSAQNMAAPTLTLTTNKTTMVANAKPSYDNLPTISWSSMNATACNAFGTGWSGSVALAGSQKVNPSVTTTYMMVCIGAGGSVVRSVTVNVTSASSQTASVIGAFDQITNTSATQTQTSFTYTWNHNLQIGSSYTADISALQTALTREGVYSGEITSGFYSKTFTAVKEFQKKYAIESTGFVGLQTRTKLNGLYGN